MALAVPCEPRSIQQLLAPLLAIDRKLQELEDAIYDLQDMSDDFSDWQLTSATRPLHHALRQLRIVRTELQIFKMITMCRIIRDLHRHWAAHGRPPFLDLDLAV